MGRENRKYRSIKESRRLEHISDNKEEKNTG